MVFNVLEAMRKIKLNKGSLSCPKSKEKRGSKSNIFTPSKSWVYNVADAELQIGDGSDVTLETASPLIDDPDKSPLRGELDSAVNQYLNQVRSLGYKDSFSARNSFKDDGPIYQVSSKAKKSNSTSSKDKLTKKQSLKDQSRKNAELLYRFHRRSRSIERLEHQPIIVDDIDENKNSKDDIYSVQFQLTDEEYSQEEVLDEDNKLTKKDPISLDNPLYVKLLNCSSGNTDKYSDHFYENESFGGSDGELDHIYENVDNNYHVYDVVPKKSNPDVPPKPDFLSQLAARQSAPIKKAWNPFVEDTDTKSIEATYSNIDFSKKKVKVKLTEETKRCTNPFRTNHPVGTSEQTIVVDGSETSDLGSSGEDTTSVDDWPLPPSPAPASDTFVSTDSPLPPPPPELALQQLEEEVLKEEEEDRRTAIKQQKKEIQDNYLNQFASLRKCKNEEKVEAVNSRFIHLQDETEDTTETSEEVSEELQFVDCRETIRASKKQPRIIEINPDEQEFDTPAIRHSVIIALKDSCSLALKPSEVKKKESLKKGDTILKSGIIRKSNSYRTSENNLINGSLYRNKSDAKLSQHLKKDSKFAFENQFDMSAEPESMIEISDDGSWNTTGNIQSENMNCRNAEIDPFTGQPIPPPRAERNNESKDILPAIPAPPEIFLSTDGSDGVFSASCITTHSGPSSIASNVTTETTPETLSLKTVKEQLTTVKTIGHRSRHFSVETSDSEDRPSTPSNIGQAIMESYERELQKKKEQMNLPEVSLLEFGDSVKDLEQQRRSVIKQMTVKAKKKDSWIKTCKMHDSGATITTPTAPSRTRKKSGDHELCHEEKSSITKKSSLFADKHDFSVHDTSSAVRPARKKYDKPPIIPQRVVDDVLFTHDQTSSNQTISTVHQTSVFHSAHTKDIVHDESILVKEKNEINLERSRNENANFNISTTRGQGDPTADVDSNLRGTGVGWGDMLAPATAEEEGGWETVANVKFEASDKVPEIVEGIAPPAEFMPAPPPQFDNSPLDSFEEPKGPEPELETTIHNIESKCPQQYVYGLDSPKSNNVKPILRVVESKKESSQQNVIESEIREQQKREQIIRRETEPTREKGASSPASHDSDEGFVDRHPVEEGTNSPRVHTPPLTPSPRIQTPPLIQSSTIVEPPMADNFRGFHQNATLNHRPSSEDKIALEIRNLREREEELRMMRQEISSSRENLLDDEDAASHSSRDPLDDQLTSFTTTTDEGNFSEYGDHTSSEDKSSDGSNSRITSPDLPTFHHRKTVAVKPYDEDLEEEQPVYTRMKKESVIEREIRLAREREEAFRKEKGLLQVSNGNTPAPKSTPTTKSPVARLGTNYNTFNKIETPNKIASTRIQEINQNNEMTGKISPFSEDSVDSKVSRILDIAEQSPEPSRHRPSSSASMNSESSRASVTSESSRTSSSPSNSNLTTPTNKRCSSPLSPTYSPYSPPAFTPSPLQNSSSRLTRSLSTNNLSSHGIRAPKGLMQKFIASRGKLSTSAFASPSSINGTPPTPKGVPTRPMKVEPKKKDSWQAPIAPVIPEQPKSSFRRANLSAEERIQEELKEMQKREEELKRERARCLAQSQPNLVDMDDDLDDIDSSIGVGESLSFVSASAYKQEANLRAAHSNPNLLDDDPQTPSNFDKSSRRRSALIAQWENRIQQTTET